MIIHRKRNSSEGPSGLLRFAVSTLACFALAASPLGGAEGKEIKIRGYVTAVKGLTDFEIAQFKAKGTPQTPLVADFSEVDPDPTLPQEKKSSDKKDKAAEEVAYRWEDLRVGDDVEIKGRLDPATNTISVESARVLVDPARTKPHGEVFLYDAPKLEKRGAHWIGSVRADGYELLFDEVTKIRVFPTSAEKKATKEAKKGKKEKKADAPVSTLEDEMQAESIDFTSPDQIKPGMVLRWSGDLQEDSKVLVRRAEFRTLETGFNVASFMEAMAGMQSKKVFQFIAPSYSGKKPKEGKVFLDGKQFKVIPNQDLHKYVEGLGTNLLPLHIQTQPKYDTKNNKPPEDAHVFRFSVMSDKKYPSPYAHSDATIVIPSAFIRILENEDQLAFVVAHEIAHVLQRHALRQERADSKKRIVASSVSIAGRFVPGVGGALMRIGGNLTLAAIHAGYRRQLENQADRIALQTMIDAGYDPRQALRVWELVSANFGDSKFKTFWSSHDSNTKRRSYLAYQLTRMRSVDVQATTANPENQKRFDQFKQLIEEVEAPKKKKKA